LSIPQPGRPQSKHGNAASDSEPNPWSDFSDSNTDDSSADPHLPEGNFATQVREVTAIVDQLYRLSAVIQRSGTKYRHRSADKNLQEEEYIELKHHLEFLILYGHEKINTEAWKSENYQELSDRVKDVSNLTAVQCRLTKANIIRRNRIEYATKRGQVPRASDAPPPPAAREEGVSNERIIQFVTETKKHIKITDQQQTPAVPSQDDVHPTVTEHRPAPPRTVTATEIGSTFFGASRTFQKGRSTVTKISRIGAHQDYPKCPANDKSFPCPYCSQSLPAEYSKDKSRWRYMCWSW